MKMKRLLLMMLVAVLLLAMIGCGGGGSSTSNQQQKSSGSTDVSTTPAADGDKEENKYAEPMTISFASVQLETGVDYNGDEFSKYFLDKYNIKWDVIPLTWDNWAERLRIWISSNDMPDLATWNYVHGEAVSYAEQGLVRRFPDDWKTRWPNVAKAYENTGLGPAVEEITGGTYFLPKPIFSTNKPMKRLSGMTSLIMRKDWLKAVGAEIKDAYTTSEINEIARKIKEQDPGNLGSKLIPINTRYSTALYVWSNNAHAVGNNQFYIGDDNKYHWGPAAPSTLVGLKLFKEAFDEGLLNREFFALGDNEDVASFYAAGQTAICFTEGQATNLLVFEKELKKNLGLEADEVMHVAHILGEDGKFHSEEVINYWTVSIFSPKMEDAKFERIMDMFDFVASDEGQLMVRLGFKDKDYTIEADGSYKILLEEGMEIHDKYPSIRPLYENMVILGDDFMLINPAYPKKYRDRALEIYKSKEKYADDSSMPPFDWKQYFHDSPNRRRLNINLGEAYANLVTMGGDIEANWRKWIADNAPIVDPVIEELNAFLD